MTDEERGFIRAIIAEPDNDGFRLIYADWLEDNADAGLECEQCGGEGWLFRSSRETWRNTSCHTCNGTGTVSDSRAERAELIRVQIELHHMRMRGQPAVFAEDDPHNVRFEKLCNLRDELCPGDRLYPEGSLNDYDYFGIDLWWRGFPYAINGTAQQWLTHADSITESFPIQRVKLATWPAVMETFSGNLDHQSMCQITPDREPVLCSLDRLDQEPQALQVLKAYWPRIEFELPDQD